MTVTSLAWQSREFIIIFFHTLSLLIFLLPKHPNRQLMNKVRSTETTFSQFQTNSPNKLTWNWTQDPPLMSVTEHLLEPGPMQTHLSLNHLLSVDHTANYIEPDQCTRNKSERSVVIHLFSIHREFLLFHLTFICFQRITSLGCNVFFETQYSSSLAS